MSYEIRLTPVAQKQLDKTTGQDYQRIARAITALRHEPGPARVKKLADSGLWRVRVGHYRIVYAIDAHEQLITIARVARRTESTYKRI